MKGPVLFQLGGSHFQVPFIRRAREMGLAVVVCDINPDCPGRAHADAYLRVSTTDVEAISRAAIDHGAVGISAYASDPASLTASMVAESLELPGNPSSAVRTLTQKDRFRAFLRDHGFATPAVLPASDEAEFVRAVDRIGAPCLVKPVDSSGSRGISLLGDRDDHLAAYRLAYGNSALGRVVVEQLVTGDGPQLAGDAFVADGKLIFACFGNENFDRLANPLAPVGESFPSSIDTATETRVRDELQRLVRSIGLKGGALNFDIVIGGDGSVYFLDVGPRNGGNGIPEVLTAHTGIDLLRLSVLWAIGEPIDPSSLCVTMHSPRQHATYVVHSRMDGILQGFDIDERIKRCIRSLHLFQEKVGQTVRKFTDSRDSLGYALLEFGTELKMEEVFPVLPELIRARVRRE